MKHLLACGILGMALITNVQAQADGGRQRQNKGFDMKAMMEKRIGRYQEQLGFSDDEWTVVSPMLIDVVTKQMTGMRNARFMGGGGRGNRGGGQQGGGNQQKRRMGQGQQSEAAKDLQKSIKDSSVTDQVLTQKLTKVRAERAKTQQELQAARNTLREVLTPRQEAQLVLFGILD